MEHGGILSAASTLLLNRFATDRKGFVVGASGTLLTLWALLRLVRKQKERQIDNLVPAVSGALPVLGHALQINKDPLGFIQQCKAQYGPAFSIKLVTQELYVLTGKLIPELLTASRRYVSFVEGVETIMPVERVMRLSYEHKHVEEQVGPRDRHPSELKSILFARLFLTFFI